MKLILLLMQFNIQFVLSYTNCMNNTNSLNYIKIPLRLLRIYYIIIILYYSTMRLLLDILAI